MSKEVVLITGASSGLGRALALVYAKNGHNLLLTGQDKARLQETVDLVGGNTYSLAQDLSTPDAVDRLMAFIEVEQLTVTILINNAGLGSHANFAELTRAEIHTLLQVNIQSLVALTSSIIPMMIAHGHGLIVNIASVYAYASIPEQVLYAASKAFVKSFSLGLHNDLKPYNIPVSCICPGSITKTQFRSRMGLQLVKGRFSATSDAVAEKIVHSLKRPRLIYVPFWYNKLFVFLMQIIPKRLSPSLISFIVYRLRKIKERSSE